MSKRHLIRVAVVATVFLLAGAAPARASSIELTVLGTAGPWNWVNGGLNTGLQFGVNDHTAPATVDLLNTLGLAPGSNLFILYKSGTTSAFNPPVPIDQTGYVSTGWGDNQTGSSGKPFPSRYLPWYWGVNSADPANASDYGLFLQSLLGAITDASGSVVMPIAVGPVLAINVGSGYQQSFGIGVSFQIPAGGRYLQLGFNDDIFIDNSGSMRVCVAGSDAEVQGCVNGATATPVPEPGTLALFGLGMAGIALARRRYPLRSI